jgi:hypothetical protein
VASNPQSAWSWRPKYPLFVGKYRSRNFFQKTLGGTISCG